MLKRRQPPDLRDPANVHLCSPITAGLIPAHFRVLRSRTGWSWSVGPAATTCLRESLVAGWGSQGLLKGQKKTDRQEYWRETDDGDCHLLQTYNCVWLIWSFDFAVRPGRSCVLNQSHWNYRRPPPKKRFISTSLSTDSLQSFFLSFHCITGSQTAG